MIANRGPSFHLQRAFRGRRWPRPRWKIAPPDRRMGFDVKGSPSYEIPRPDQGGSKTYGAPPVGSDGVCGRLADGYHYPQETRGSTEARNRLRA